MNSVYEQHRGYPVDTFNTVMLTSLCGSSHVTVRDIRPLRSSEDCTARLGTWSGTIGVQD